MTLSCCWLQAKVTTSTHLGEEYDSLMAPVLATKGNAVSCEDMRNCFYGAYIDSSKGPEDRQYSPVTDVPALISTMEGYLVDHNGVIIASFHVQTDKAYSVPVAQTCIHNWLLANST